MKPRVLFIYIDYSAKCGILPYLTTLFHSYLDIDSKLVDQVDFNNIFDYKMLLFSSPDCQAKIYKKVSAYGIPMHICKRAINYTYLHRILEIPANSRVCIVNNRELNCSIIKESLTALGFTSFRYEFYYPGAPSVSPEVQYAITPGESRYVPPSIQNIIDIGDRIVDMGTLCNIIAAFQLPETILNQVSENFTKYMANLVRTMERQVGLITQKALDISKSLESLPFGICITTDSGEILHKNKAFGSLLCLPNAQHLEKNMSAVLSKLHVPVDFGQLLVQKEVLLQGADGKFISLSFSGQYMSVSQKRQYLFTVLRRQTPLSESEASKKVCCHSPVFYGDTDILRLFPASKHLRPLIHQLELYAQTDFPVLITGQAGSCQFPLACYLHEHSTRKLGELVCVDLTYLSSASNMQEVLEENFFQAQDGTLFLEHINMASPALQSLLCLLLKKQTVSSCSPYGGSGKTRIICSADSIKSVRDHQHFSSELFYMLSPFLLSVPPLKELRDEFPVFLHFFLSGLMENTGLQPDMLFSEQLLHYLLKIYDYPGNLREMENICRYFSCIYNGSRLTLSQLPSYIITDASDSSALSSEDLKILEIIHSNPHCGRNKISQLLNACNIPIAPGQLRTCLANLHKKNYISILKTKQGCVITELGSYVLSRSMK